MRPTVFSMLLIAVSSLVVGAAEGPSFNRDPDEARLVTEDLDRFWKAYELVEKGGDAEAIFQAEYLDPASPGLKAFVEMRIGGVKELVRTIEDRPDYYRQLKASSDRVGEFEKPIRQSLHRLKELYPEAVFPDVYFVVGRMTSGGTLTSVGLLIGVEMHGRGESVDLEELSDWHREVLKPVEDIPHIVAHELIHYQQRYGSTAATLLEKSIDEGSADFLAELISGKHINEHIHRWANPRQPQLWREFRRRMHRKDLDGWLYNGNSADGRPADLGYYMGYKICQAYYQRAEDKRQAIRDMLQIEDFGEFLAESGYQGGVEDEG